MLEHSCNEFIRKMFFPHVCFFPCVHTSFFDFVFAKLVMPFVCLFHFCVSLHVFICVVLNQLFVYLVTSLFFCVCMHLSACLFFCSVFLGFLFAFFKQIEQICMCCFHAGFAWCHFLVFGNCRALPIRFFLCSGL